MCQNNGATIADISACQKENIPKLEALDSTAGKIKQDMTFIQARNEQLMSYQADNCNKMAAMESKMAAMESKMEEMLSSTAKVSFSVQKELEMFEEKFNKEMLSSSTNVSVSVQKELKSLEKRLNESSKPAVPNIAKSTPGQKIAKQTPEAKIIKSTAPQTKPVFSAKPVKGAESQSSLNEQNPVKLALSSRQIKKAANSVKGVASQTSPAGQGSAKIVLVDKSANIVKSKASRKPTADIPPTYKGKPKIPSSVNTSPPNKMAARQRSHLDGGNIMYTVLVLLCVMVLPARASGTLDNSPTAILASMQTSPFRTVYPILELESRTWAYQIKEVEDSAYDIIDDGCWYLAMADEQCETSPSSCRSTMLSMENFKKAITKSFEVIFMLQRLCDVGNQPQSKQAIEDCRLGKSWRTKDFTGKKYEFLNEKLGDFTTRFKTSKKLRKGRSISSQKIRNDILSRQPRLAMFLPVVISIAAGAGIIGTSAITAKVVAEEESNRVVTEVRNGRNVDIANNLKNNFLNYNHSRVLAGELDIIRMTEAISTHSTVLLHDSEDLKETLTQLVSRKEKLKYTSTVAEEYWSAIRDVNMENNIGLTTAEVNRKTRLSADLTTLVTTLSPISNRSASCRNQILTKTLLIPVIDHHKRTEIEIKGGRMIPRNLPLAHEDPHYFIIPKKSVISRETDLFGRASHVVGRVCVVSSSINASSITSTDAISETFLLEFQGTIQLNETCAGQNGSVSNTHTVYSPARITVPVLCSVSSQEFSCGAVQIRSGDTKLVHTTHHRTIIVQDNLVSSKVNMANTSFVSDTSISASRVGSGLSSWWSSITQTAKSYKYTFIILGITIVVLAVAAVPVMQASVAMVKKTGRLGGISITNYNSNSNPLNNSNIMEGAMANLEAGKSLPALPAPLPAVIEEQEEEENQEEEEEEEEQLVIVDILRKPVHLRSPAERVAADTWAKFNDPYDYSKDPFGLTL